MPIFFTEIHGNGQTKYKGIAKEIQGDGQKKYKGLAKEKIPSKLEVAPPPKC